MLYSIEVKQKNLYEAVAFLLLQLLCLCSSLCSARGGDIVCRFWNCICLVLRGLRLLGGFVVAERFMGMRTQSTSTVAVIQVLMMGCLGDSYSCEYN